MDEKYIQDLYNSLGGEGVFGKYEDFSKLISEDDAYRKEVYNGLGGEQVFGVYNDFDALVKKKEPSEPVSPVGSDVAPTSSRDEKIRELTAKAVAGDQIAKVGLERLKKQGEKRATTVDPREVDVTVEADNTVVRAQPIKPFAKTDQPVAEFLQATPAAFRVSSEEIQSLDAYMGGRTRGVDFEEVKKQGKKEGNAYSAVRSQFEALEDDYLDYLDVTNPELGEYRRNRITELRKKEKEGALTDVQKKELIQFQNEAVEARNFLNEAKMWEVKEQADIPTFQKEMTAIATRAGQIKQKIDALGINEQSPPNKRQEAQVLIDEYNALINRASEVRAQTGFTEEQEAKYMDAAKQLIGGETFMMVQEGVRFPGMKAREDEAERAREARKETAEMPVIGAIQGAYEGLVGTVDNMTAGIFQLPKVLGDALGDNDYDFIDELYDAASQERMESDVKYGDLGIDSSAYKYSRMLGEGIASVAMFAAGGEVAALAGAPARLGVIGTGFVTSASDYYQEALATGMNPTEAARTGTILASVSAAIEGVVPDVKYFNASGFRKSVLAGVANGNTFKESLKNAMDALPDSTKSYLESALKEGAEEGLQQFAVDVTKEAVNTVSGSRLTGMWDEEAYWESVLAGAMVGGVMNVFARPQSQSRSPIQEDLLGQAIDRSETVMPIVQSTNPEAAVEAQQIIDEAKEIKEGLFGAPSFEGLAKPVQNHVISELLRKKKLEEGMKASGVQPESTLSEIAAIEAEVKTILDTGKTLTELSEERNVAQAEPSEQAVEVELTPEFTTEEVVFPESKQQETFYHGTPKGFIAEFDESKIGSTTDDGFVGDYGKGFYFSPTEDAASTYAQGDSGNVVSVKLDMKNPLDFSAYNAYQNRLGEEMKARKITALSPKFDDLSSEIAQEVGITEADVDYMSDVLDRMDNNWMQDEFKDELRDRGYDSVIAPNGERVVFNKDQIRIIGQTASEPTVEQVAASQVEAETASERVEVDALKDVESTAKALGIIRRKRNELGDSNPSMFFPDVENGVYQTWSQYKKLNKKIKETDLRNHWKKITGEYPVDAKSEMVDEMSRLQKIHDKLNFDYKNAVDVSQAYHAAKADGSNPELVKAVEDLLAPQGQVAPLANEQGADVSPSDSAVDYDTELDSLISEIKGQFSEARVFVRKDKDGKTVSFELHEGAKNRQGAKRSIPVFFPNFQSNPSYYTEPTGRSKNGPTQFQIDKKELIESLESTGKKKFIDPRDKTTDSTVEKTEKPKKKSKTRKLADDLDSFADEMGKSLGANAAAIAAAARALAKILRTVDDIAQALSDWRNTDEYKALEKDDLEAIEAKVSEKVGDEYIPPTEPPAKKEEKGRRKKFKGTVEAFVERSNVPEEIKDKLRNDERSVKQSLSPEQAREVAQKIIEEIGGVEDAFNDAKSQTTEIPATFQSFIFGEALLYFKEKTNEATTQEDKDYWADMQNEAHQALASKAEMFGRYNAYIGTLYTQSNYAVVRQAKKAMERANKLYAPQARKGAKEVGEILNRPEEIEQAIEEAVEKAVESKDKVIAELEKKIAEFKKDPKKSRPKSAKRIVSKEAYDAAKKALFKISANPFLDPDMYKAMATIALYHLENGYYKFSDFYKKMSKDTKGKAEEFFVDLYEEAKAKLIEDGVAESEFDTLENAEKIADEMAENARVLRERLDAEKAAKKEAAKWQGKGITQRIKEGLIEAGYGKEVSDSKGGTKQIVDWRKVTGSERDAGPIVVKIKEALKDKIPPSELDSVLRIIEKEANALIIDKKRRAVAAKVKQYETRRKNRLLTRVRRNTRIQGLLETWKQGGLSDKVILERLAEDFGVIEFSAEQEAKIEKMLDDIDKASIGAERERLEEALQAYLEYSGHPLILSKAVLERMKARMLMGITTIAKNAIGGSFDSAMKVGFEFFSAQVDSIAKKGGTDKYIGKVIWNAHKKSLAMAMDVFLRGGVDLGTAMSEITGNKEGSPAVRYMENMRSDFKNQKDVRDKVSDPVTKGERQFLRTLSAWDTFNQAMTQEAVSYNFIKAVVRERNPNMSEKEVQRQAYEIMYSVELTEARAQAAKEFADRGINIETRTDKVRFERRVNEIVEQAREAKAEGVTRAAQLQGNIITYKAPDVGLYSVAGVALYEVLRAIPKKIAAKKSKSESPAVVKALEAVEFSYDLTIANLIPFVKVLGNVTEKMAELYPPYGLTKAIGYATAGKIAKDKTLYRRSAEYATRAMMGYIVGVILMSLADEDEDGLPMIYGEGPEDYRKKANLQKARPENTVVIGGHPISMDWFGPFAFAMKNKANDLDTERYKGKEKTIFERVLGRWGYTVNSLYFEQTQNMIRSINDDNPQKQKAFFERLGAEILTRATIPFTSAIRQTSQVISPEAVRPVTFTEQLMKYSGMQGLIGRPAVDYRGRPYDMGQVYTSSADGFVKMFTGGIEVDEVDQFVFKYHPGVMGPTRGDERASYVDGEDELVPMSNKDFYELNVKYGKNLDGLLRLWIVNKPVDSLSNMTASKMEDMLREAELELIEEGREYSMRDVRYRAQRNFDKDPKMMAEAYKKQLTKLSTLAKNYAMYNFYKNKGLRVPLELENARTEYEAEVSKFVE